MHVNAVSLLIRAATTSTSGTLNDLTTDLIMANNNNLSLIFINLIEVKQSHFLTTPFDVSVGINRSVSMTADKALPNKGQRLISKLWSSVDTSNEADQLVNSECKQAERFVSAAPHPITAYSVKAEPMRAQLNTASDNILSSQPIRGRLRSTDAAGLSNPCQPLVRSTSVEEDNRKNESILSRVVKQFKGSQENLRSSAENIAKLFTTEYTSHAHHSQHERSSSEPPPERGQSDSGVDCNAGKNEPSRTLDDNSLPVRRPANKQEPQKRWSDSDTLNQTEKSGSRVGRCFVFDLLRQRSYNNFLENPCYIFQMFRGRGGVLLVPI